MAQTSDWRNQMLLCIFWNTLTKWSKRNWQSCEAAPSGFVHTTFFLSFARSNHWATATHFSSCVLTTNIYIQCRLQKYWSEVVVLFFLLVLTLCRFSKIRISDLVASHHTRNELAHSSRVHRTAGQVVNTLLCTLIMPHEFREVHGLLLGTFVAHQLEH